MARGTSFVCQDCGTAHAKWAGRCDACGAWNALVEEAAPRPPGATAPRSGRLVPLGRLAGESADPPRLITGIAEFDRVCGGGFVPGSALLVGGDPGIGKSTLLLQVMAALGAQGHRVVYVSGEEALAQIRLRARRLGVAEAPVDIAAECALGDILATLSAGPKAAVVVIDSIQTLFTDALDSAPGTVAQLRGCAQELVRFAKTSGTAVILVGHVTKEGQIAGPRVVEHLVDGVLYFEGERGHQFRVLRAVKNRFGPTDEIGVFEMTGMGLCEVANPSALFLGSRSGVAGASVFAGMEGTRPVLVEIQALVAPSPPGTPRRTVVGWDSGRLAMLLAVLDTRCGLRLSGNDVYLNIAGGLRISEPAADLAVAAALISSLTGVPVPADTVLFGEISLAGEVRPVAQAEARLKEAAKLGFARAILPQSLPGTGRRRGGRAAGLDVTEIDALPALLARLAPEGMVADSAAEPQASWP